MEETAMKARMKILIELRTMEVILMNLNQNDLEEFYQDLSKLVTKWVQRLP